MKSPKTSLILAISLVIVIGIILFPNPKLALAQTRASLNSLLANLAQLAATIHDQILNLQIEIQELQTQVQIIESEPDVIPPPPTGSVVLPEPITPPSISNPFLVTVLTGVDTPSGPFGSGIMVNYKEK